MANPFLNNDAKDIETAIMLEQAYQHNIGRAVAYTDGSRIFINTDDNLFSILPAYDNNMLKWLLWHERYHVELRHHNRFFKYLDELNKKDTMDKFKITKDEVNIIMDILVHDSLSKMFPELVETALKNLAQMRNQNSLRYTFKSTTLEEMLDEYSKHKHGDDEDKDKEDTDTPTHEESSETTPPEEPPKERPDKKEDHPEEKEETPAPTPEPPEEKSDKHDDTDWSKLDDIDTDEFINSDTGDKYVEQINRLKRKKFKLAKLTQTLNGLATTTKQRSYAMPSTIHVGRGVLLKGRTPGKTALYLCFDASGSMCYDMDTFKEIISKSIPQAMDVPTVWFSGYNSPVPRDPSGRSHDYFKGTFKDFMKVQATNGYSDDGDRTIELCWKAEQMGYSPIGITDGGGQLDWSIPMLKQLKRTVLVGDSQRWLELVQKVNPKVQIICTKED